MGKIKLDKPGIITGLIVSTFQIVVGWLITLNFKFEVGNYFPAIFLLVLSYVFCLFIIDHYQVTKNQKSSHLKFYVIITFLAAVLLYLIIDNFTLKTANDEYLLVGIYKNEITNNNNFSKMSSIKIYEAYHGNLDRIYSLVSLIKLSTLLLALSLVCSISGATLLFHYRRKSKAHKKVEIDNTNDNFKFHYQIKNNKLLLFGNFQAEQIKLIKSRKQDGNMLYLIHENKHYRIYEDDDLIKPLVAE